MSQHTPGPWIVKGHAVEAIDDRRTIVCEVTGGLENPTMQADARLIAAAPELLAVLEQLMDSHHCACRTCDRAESAIRKATETP